MRCEVAYCQIYCDSDPACLGFVAVAVVVEQNDATPQQQQQQQQKWIECHISTDTPTHPAYNSNGNAHHEKCWRTIPESCFDVPLPQIVDTHSQVDSDAPCDTCVEAGCTCCEVESALEEEADPEASLCLCEEFYGVCNDFLYGKSHCVALLAGT